MFELLEDIFESDVFMALVLILVFAAILYQTRVFEKAFSKVDERLDKQEEAMKKLSEVSVKTDEEPSQKDEVSEAETPSPKRKKVKSKE